MNLRRSLPVSCFTLHLQRHLYSRFLSGRNLCGLCRAERQHRDGNKPRFRRSGVGHRRWDGGPVSTLSDNAIMVKGNGKVLILDLPKRRSIESHSNHPDSDAQDARGLVGQGYVNLARPAHDCQVPARMRNRNRRLVAHLRCRRWSGDQEDGYGLRRALALSGRMPASGAIRMEGEWIGYGVWILSSVPSSFHPTLPSVTSKSPQLESGVHSSLRGPCRFRHHFR